MKRILKQIVTFVLIISFVAVPVDHVKASTEIIIVDDYTYASDYNRKYINIGDKGTFNIDYDGRWGEITRLEFEVSEEGIINISDDGSYEAVGSGSVDVYINGYDEDGYLIFDASYGFGVYTDMSKASLNKSSVNLYLVEGYYWTSTEISLKNCPEIDIYDFDYQCSSKKLSASCYLDAKNKKIVVNGYKAGKGKITVTVNGNKFSFTVKIVKVKIDKKSLLVIKNKKSKVKVKNYPGKLKWYSTNKKVASINSKGVVKGKKLGNVVVYTKIGDVYLGCAVSVIQKKMKKVIASAYKIKKGKYDQSLRMNAGYYDCSSLVWKSYKSAGIYLKDRNYAPVAADLAKYYVKKKRKIKGGYTYSNISKMKFRVGDLFFCEDKDDNKNGRYRGIYHVELFTGYTCTGFYSNGKPIVVARWANKPDDYYFKDKNLMVRPIK